jgi:hypothetical protein
MRRLTAKDVAKRKKEGDEPAPNFYALSRDHALPESAPVRSTSAALPPAMAAETASSRPVASLADVELAILEKRHAEVMDRINLLSSQGSRPDSSVLNHVSLLGQQAPASLGQQDLASLQQRFSSAQNPSAPVPISVASSGNQFFRQQQQQQQQQPIIASLLAALGGNGSIAVPVPAPASARPIPTHSSTGSDIGALLQQAGLTALLQQGGGGGGGQPNVANLITQLCQSASAGGNSQPASAPAHTPSAPAPIASSFAPPFGGFGGNQVIAAAPTAIGSCAPVGLAQLLGQNSNGLNSDLQRQLLEARVANTDLSAFLAMNSSGLSGLAGFANQPNGGPN